MSAVETRPTSEVQASKPNDHGYQAFTLGEFRFSRDEYFVYV